MLVLVAWLLVLVASKCYYCWLVSSSWWEQWSWGGGGRCLTCLNDNLLTQRVDNGGINWRTWILNLMVLASKALAASCPGHFQQLVFELSPVVGDRPVNARSCSKGSLEFAEDCSPKRTNYCMKSSPTSYCTVSSSLRMFKAAKY